MLTLKGLFSRPGTFSKMSRIFELQPRISFVFHTFPRVVSTSSRYTVLMRRDHVEDDITVDLMVLQWILWYYSGSYDITVDLMVLQWILWYYSGSYGITVDLMVLQWILKEQTVKMGTGLNCLRIRFSGSCKRGNVFLIVKIYLTS
jgi:hypothetical protein